MAARNLPAQKEIDHLESHVQEAVQVFATRRSNAFPLLRKFHPGFRTASKRDVDMAHLTEDDARLLVAREHGFDTWAEIRAEAEKGPKARWNLPIHERTDDPVFGRAIQDVNAGRVARLEAALRKDPTLARATVRLEQAGAFSNPTLLEIAAATHQRGGKVPNDLLRVIDLLLAAQPPQREIQNSLNLASAQPWPGHDDKQRATIRRLIKAGAKPEPALSCAIFQSVVVARDELSRHVGKLDLVATAAIGRIADLKRRLPHARALERRKALALAAVNGQTESVRVLLDAGLNPNRFNPQGFYEHSLPIHQAVWFGHLDTVRLLADRGTDLTVRDREHHGTPLGWAAYANQRAIARFLKARGAP